MPVQRAQFVPVGRPPAPAPRRAAAGRARTAFAARLREAVGAQTYAQIARRTGFNHETVRRYLNGRVVSVRFVAAVAEAYGVSADWLMLGRGSMRPGAGGGGAGGLHLRDR